jgi:hypothetical protein
VTLACDLRTCGLHSAEPFVVRDYLEWRVLAVAKNRIWNSRAPVMAVASAITDWKY